MHRKLKKLKQHLNCTWDALYGRLSEEGVLVSRSTFDNWCFGRAAPNQPMIVNAIEKAIESLYRKG